MNNIILPVTSDFEQTAQWLKTIKIKNTTFYVGVTSKGKEFFKNSKSVKVFVFVDGSAKEEIINSLSKEVGQGRIVILRKLITQDELEKFIASQSDITVCATKKRNKFSEFFYRIWAKMVKFLFDFKFFDGDVSVVAISSRVAPTAKYISNLSHATRVNRWKGVSTSAVETSTPPAKKEYSRARSNCMLIGWIALFLAIVASITVYYLFMPVSFLSVFLWICALLISILCLLLSIIIYIMYHKTGQRMFKTAKREE